MKKVFSLILVFLIVFSLFGCGSKEEEKLNTVATDADIATL